MADNRRKMIIKGVGQMMARIPGGNEVITLGSLQNLKIDMTVDIDEIYGGDGMFAIDTLVQNKAIELQATDAKFDLAAVSIMTGSSITSPDPNSSHDSAYLWQIGEIVRVQEMGGAKYVVPRFGDKIVDVNSISVRKHHSNSLLRNSAAGTANFDPIGETNTSFTYNNENGSIELSGAGVSVGEDLVISYKRKADAVNDDLSVMDIFSNETPFMVHIVHTGVFQQKDNTFQGVQTELYACQAKGTFSMDFQRATAMTSVIDLRVIEPENACGKMGTIKRFKIDKDECNPERPLF